MTNQNTHVRVYHLSALTEAERKRLNADSGRWDSDPRFNRYATISFGESCGLVDQVREAWDRGEYHLAATVATDSKDEAFSIMSYIDCSWKENDSVTDTSDCERLTSPGDILIDSSGRAFVVARMSYEEIDVFEFDLSIDCDVMRDGSNARGELDEQGEIIKSGDQS